MIIKQKLKGNILYKHCICEVPTKYKIKIAKLLSQIMKDYNINHKDSDMEKAFKDTFKSNLYWIIDDLIGEVKKSSSFENIKILDNGKVGK